MKCLLDTSALIWTLTDEDRLSRPAREMISDTSVIKTVSVVSLYEMAIKMAMKKLTIQGIKLSDLPALLYSNGVELIVLEPFETVALEKLPLKDDHRDPFDRMLICQAIFRNLTLLSSDTKIVQYREHGLSLLW